MLPSDLFRAAIRITIIILVYTHKPHTLTHTNRDRYETTQIFNVTSYDFKSEVLFGLIITIIDIVFHYIFYLINILFRLLCEVFRVSHM